MIRVSTSAEDTVSTVSIVGESGPGTSQFHVADAATLFTGKAASVRSVIAAVETGA
jgi:hypothetical protein